MENREGTKRFRYLLTLNSSNREERDAVLKGMRKEMISPKILRMDESFGPCNGDGSFITLFSSDNVSQDKCIDVENELIMYDVFTDLAGKQPKSKFTLKAKKKDSAEIDHMMQWNIPTIKTCSAD